MISTLMVVSFIRMFLLVLIGFFLQTYLSTRLIPPAPQHVVQELNVKVLKLCVCIYVCHMYMYVYAYLLQPVYLRSRGQVLPLRVPL